MSGLLRAEGDGLAQFVKKGSTAPMMRAKREFVSRNVSGIKKRVFRTL